MAPKLDTYAFPPRGMRREAAAWYVGLSTTKFDALVADGRMPKPNRVDGCVIWDRHQLDAAFDDLSNDNEASGWDDVTNDRREAITCTSEFVQNRLRKLQGNADYDADAYEQLLTGQITHLELPPGRYPNGLRIYADGEWEEIVRGSPMKKRELKALGAYFQAKDAPLGYVKGGGWDTTERLAVRGFVEIRQHRGADRFPYYGVTPAGEAEWQRISETRADVANK